MLAAALADPDPVLLFEHGSLYNAKGTLSREPVPVDIASAAVRREGTDVTVVAYGGMLPRALAAADDLAVDGISAEVVDLRVLRPLDEDTILASVRRTHRAVVVDEGWRSGSLAAEVAARISEQAFFDLDAPVARVCTAEVPLPYAHQLEDAALPGPEAIAEAARACVGDGHG
jgi:pyruvate dehydrogenase E1 component beta subunit